MTSDLMTVKQMAAEIGCHHTSIRGYIGVLGIKPDAIMPTLPMATRLYTREKFDLIKAKKERIKKGKSTNATLNGCDLSLPEKKARGLLKPEKQRVYTIKEVAAHLNRPVSSIYTFMKELGIIPKYKDGVCGLTADDFLEINARSAIAKRVTRRSGHDSKKNKPTFWQKLSNNLRAWGVI